MAKAHVQKLGPGELTLGEIGDELDISCQLTECSLNPDVDSEDDTPVLCGDIVPGNRTYTWALEMSVFQDWRADGVNAFSIEHRGKRVPFTFSPDDNGVEVKGEVMIDPMSLGGEVGARATADWELSVVGEPTFTWDDASADDPDDED